MESANKMLIPLTICGFHFYALTPLTICGFHLQFADSLTVADSATAQFYDTNVLSIVCGFHKLFWIPQIQLRIPQIRLFLEQF